jgi:hypothetical protein
MRLSIARLSQNASGNDKVDKRQTPQTSDEYVCGKEYFGFNKYSYFDIESEMVKYRQPQPSALPKVEYTWSQQPMTIKKK